MKKYVKPELFFESFELSQSIAACGIDVKNSTSKEECAALDEEFWPGMGGTQVFQADACTLDFNTIEVYCYTYGTSEAGRVFNS